MSFLTQVIVTNAALMGMRKSLDTPTRLPDWDKFLKVVWVGSGALFLLSQVSFLSFLEDWYFKMMFIIFAATVYQLKDYRPARLFGTALIPMGVAYVISIFFTTIFPDFYDQHKGDFSTLNEFVFIWLMAFGGYALVQVNKERKIQAKLDAEKKADDARKAELERLVSARTTELTQQKKELEKTLQELQSTQTQLVHAEKMASLGELTAGIAHEIQNPLNFVNNFSELSVELSEELEEELAKPDIDLELVKELVGNLKQNQTKINHHGKRAASIVTGMLQHSRTSTGKKEPIDINVLADEYLRLSYHGLRAKEKSFNAKMLTNFDPKVGKIAGIPQDLGRVLLNLINNAFYAVSERQKESQSHPTESGQPKYEPTVMVTTQRMVGGNVEIRIKDNGTGIPEALKAKIFQPFFTTKPTGKGTGLGLSLAYDIVTKGHGGTMEVQSEEGKGTEFLIKLPSVASE